MVSAQGPPQPPAPSPEKTKPRFFSKEYMLTILSCFIPVTWTARELLIAKVSATITALKIALGGMAWMWFTETKAYQNLLQAWEAVCNFWQAVYYVVTHL